MSPVASNPRVAGSGTGSNSYLLSIQKYGPVESGVPPTKDWLKDVVAVPLPTSDVSYTMSVYEKSLNTWSKPLNWKGLSMSNVYSG